ncbi:MAG: hypothetical protein AB7D57_07335 [Desulfovibrionaceae bacterium]
MSGPDKTPCRAERGVPRAVLDLESRVLSLTRLVERMGKLLGKILEQVELPEDLTREAGMLRERARVAGE